MRVEAHATQTVIPSGDGWLYSSVSLHGRFYQKLVFSQGTKKKVYKQTNLKEDMTEVLHYCPVTEHQCHINGYNIQSGKPGSLQGPSYGNKLQLCWGSS